MGVASEAEGWRIVSGVDVDLTSWGSPSYRDVSNDLNSKVGRENKKGMLW